MTYPPIQVKPALSTPSFIDQRRERFFLFALAGIQFTHILDFMIMMPLGPEFIKAFELAFRRDERVMRYLTVSLDKWGVEFNHKKRNGEIKSSTSKEKKAEANRIALLDEEEL